MGKVQPQEPWRHDNKLKDLAGVPGAQGTGKGAAFIRYPAAGAKPGIDRFPAAKTIADTGSFSGLPGGNRNNNGNYNNLGNNGNWWSATESTTNNAWNRKLDNDNTNVNRNDNHKENGFSVRCVRDE
jgi:uncharacterized protein (TIGR02145 family)